MRRGNRISRSNAAAFSPQVGALGAGQLLIDGKEITVEPVGVDRQPREPLVGAIRADRRKPEPAGRPRRSAVRGDVVALRADGVRPTSASSSSSK